MNSKSLIWISLFIGSTIGSLIPSLWGDGFLSVSSVLFSGVGGIAGIWLAFRLTN